MLISELASDPARIVRQLQAQETRIEGSIERLQRLAAAATEENRAALRDAHVRLSASSLEPYRRLRPVRSAELLVVFQNRGKPTAFRREVSMQRVIQSVLAAAILLGMESTKRAESVMKQCGEQWQAAKSAGTTNGATWPQFLAQCRTQLGSGAETAAPTPASAAQPQTGTLFPWQTSAAPAPALNTSTAAAGNQSAMKQCGAQWQAAKAAGTTGGATWPQFLKSCRTQLASTTSAPPQGGFMPAPAPAPASASSPAPTQSGSLFPWQRPATPAAGSAASTGGGSASAQAAQYRCPGSTVVWVNEHSHIYHFPGTRDYGHTKSGAYMCEVEAHGSGNRAAMNERHP
jgi:hypothetical protein